MKRNKKPVGVAKSEAATTPKHSLLGIAALLAVVLAVLFWRCFEPGVVVFSNDSPLGIMATECSSMPTSISGVWADLNWLGNEGVGPSPSVTGFLRLLTSPWVYAKFYPAITLFLLGLGAWFCFREMKLAPLACVLGAVAAALNGDFFGMACWGLEMQMVGVGAVFLALGFLVGFTDKRRWLGIVLAGFAVGMNIMESYDVGALFSLFVAAFVVYQALFLNGEGSVGAKFGKGVARTAIVAGCAALISAHTLSSLVGTQISGVAGMQQDEKIKQQEYLQKTIWSLPKAEALQVIVPGVFGYRMYWDLCDAQQPGDDEYWGSVGLPPRFSGNGYYAGVSVVLIALWAVFQSFRKKDSVFTLNQRRIIWFFAASVPICLLLSFGKYAPFYKLFYALPYASTIRNPNKFMHIFNWALLIVFAFGVHGLYATYMRNAVARVGGVFSQFKAWLARAAKFERRWINGCFVAIGLAIVGWVIYSAGKSNLEAYMQTVGISAEKAPKLAGFSIMAVGWFILLLSITTALLGAIFSGQFSGARAKAGSLVLGAFVLFDLGRAAAPWVVTWDANYKYYLDANGKPANSPIVSLLADKPYEHRVGDLPPMGPVADSVAQQQLSLLYRTYQLDWKQALFPYNNIQCFEIVQEPRATVDKGMFLSALAYNPQLQDFAIFARYPQLFSLYMRHWELTNTRYLFWHHPELVEAVNRQLDPQHRFHILKLFDFVPRTKEFSPWPVDYTTEITTNGHLALIEFTGALPRAKLFSNWQVMTNDTNTLQTLASTNFDPHQLVLVDNLIGAPNTNNVGKDAGTVEIKPNYRSKRIELEADAKTPAVLMLCDRYNPKWHVTVDEKPAELLRCNYIERGVFLTPGKHTVVFEFSTPLTTLYVSTATVAVALLLWAWVSFAGAKPLEAGESRN